MLAERRSLPRRDPRNRASAAADLGVPAHLAHNRQGSVGPIFPPVHRSVVELSGLGHQVRASSDPNLARTEFVGRSSLSVSSHEYVLGSSSSLIVSWDIRDSIGASDWLGLYKEGETSPFHYLEYKTVGENHAHVGQLLWSIGCEPFFTEDVTNVCFKYYNGTTGALRAVSPSVRVYRNAVCQPNNVNGSKSTEEALPSQNPVDYIIFKLSNLRARNLKKGIFFNPDPYIKMSIRPGKEHGVMLLPHHGQETRTSVAESTVNPNWSGQYTFIAHLSDTLEFEVKDKFSKSRPIISRFLGRQSIPLRMLIERTNIEQTECHFNLLSKNPLENISGQIVFTVIVDKKAGDPWPSSVNLSLFCQPPEGNGTSSPGAQARMHQASPRPVTMANGNVIGPSTSNDSAVSPSITNGNTPKSAVRHRQLQQSDFEPARKPKLVSRSNPAHSTWHGRTSERTHTNQHANEAPSQMSMSFHFSEMEAPPPLPPKMKRHQSHKPLHRTKALQYDANSSYMATPGSEEFLSKMQQKSQNVPPEDSFVFEIVDTDELEQSGEASSSELQALENDHTQNPDQAVIAARASPWLFIDSNANVSVVPLDANLAPELPLQSEAANANQISDISGELNLANSSVVHDPHQTVTENASQSQVAPLATPEQDSLHDGAISVENLACIQGNANGGFGPNTLYDITPTALEESFLDCVPHLDSENGACQSCSLCPSRMASDSQTGTPVKSDSGSLTEAESTVHGSPCQEETASANKSLPHVASLTLESDSRSQTPIPTPSGPELEGTLMACSMEQSSDSSDDNIGARSPDNLDFHDTTNTEQVESSDGSGSYSRSQSPSPEGAMAESPVFCAVELPQCPPTPTHHPSIGKLQGRPLTPTPGTSSTNSDIPQKPTRPPPPVPPPLPARHPPSQPHHQHTTRLPSIPERSAKFQRVELLPGEEPLPPHWEARIDSHGRIFYIDHLNRTTTWQRPSSSQQHRRGANNDLQRLQLDRRYQSIRRTISSRPPPESEEQPLAPSGAEASPASSHVANHEQHREILQHSPAVRFLTRPDFFSILHSDSDGVAMYTRTSSLKHMITRIRRDPHAFERYQHNRDLVALLNKFADTARDLPRGWETKYDRTGKQFFIDHTSRSTTFIDPRLPIDGPYVNPNKTSAFGARRRSRSAGEDDIRPECNRVPVPPPRPPHSTAAIIAHVVPHVPTAYNDKVVAFLRQPNIMDILKERHPAVGSNQVLKDKITAIRTEGTGALERLSDDIDLIILLSLFEQEIMSYVPAQFSHRSPRDSPQPSPQASPGLQRANARAPAPYKRDFDAKLRNFYRKLESKGYGQGPGKLKLHIRRDHLLEDAFNKIMAASKKDLQKSKLYIMFSGEEGLDYGGPSREFFFLLSRELFNPYYGLFEYSANDTYTVQISPMSAFVDNHHEWFRFCGRVLGLALVHQYLLDAFFTRPFYKALLRLPCSLSDLESLDAEFHQSLLWIKENDITDNLDLYFTVNEEVFGQVSERELKPSGKSIPVIEKNKKEYIERVAKWRLERGVAEQTESLVKGFYEVVDPRLVSVFDARELELVLAGSPEVDINDWRKNSEYRSGYHDNHPVIQWFWMAIEKFDNERRLRLLQFVTGTSSIPYEGFAALRGSNGPRKYCIEKWGKPTSLPRAHTCFNRLDLPPYPSFEMLYEKLLLAVEETNTFGIE